jgi:hypothetical protein
MPINIVIMPPKEIAASKALSGKIISVMVKLLFSCSAKDNRAFGDEH